MAVRFVEKGQLVTVSVRDRRTDEATLSQARAVLSRFAELLDGIAEHHDITPSTGWPMRSVLKPLRATDPDPFSLDPPSDPEDPPSGVREPRRSPPDMGGSSVSL